MGIIDVGLSRALGFATAVGDDFCTETTAEEYYHEDSIDVAFERYLTIVKYFIPVKRRRINRQRRHYWINRPDCQIASKVAKSAYDLKQRLERIGCPNTVSWSVATYLRQ